MSTTTTGSRTRSAGVGAEASRLLAAMIQIVATPVRIAANAWNTFFYSPADPAVLSLIRVLSGGMLLYTHLVWGLNLPAFLGSDGWNNPDVLAVVQDGRMVPSFWWYIPDEAAFSVHCVCVTVLFLYWIGFATRITSVLSMVITISYCYRAHMSNFGLDQINAILCLYMCIGPSGAALSVDRWLAVRRARRKAAREGRAFSIPPLPKSVSANLAIRLIQLHFCVIYIYAGLSKLQGDAWWSGEATWLAFANLEYQSLDMTWLAWYPWICDLMTHTTIIWEVSFVAAVWVRPLRPYVLFLGFLMHAGIGGMMGMWTFGLVMIFGHVAFWRNEQARWLLAKIPFRELLLGSNPVESAPGNVAKRVAGAVSQAAEALRPAILFVSTEARQRMMFFTYFWERGFPCVALRNSKEITRMRDVVPAAATVFVGTQSNDEEITQFHDDHHRTAGDRPLFMVLTEEQSSRLNGRIHTPGSHVLTGGVSLGNIRRKIEDAIFLPPAISPVAGSPPDTVARNAVAQNTAAKNTAAKNTAANDGVSDEHANDLVGAN